jgi:ribulose bisphosphate carboxylase small subunit
MNYQKAARELDRFYKEHPEEYHRVLASVRKKKRVKLSWTPRRVKVVMR